MQYEGNDIWSFYKADGSKIELSVSDIYELYTSFNEILRETADSVDYTELKKEMKRFRGVDKNKLDTAISDILKYHSTHIAKLPKTSSEIETIFLAPKQKNKRNSGESVRTYYAELIANRVLPSEARKITAHKFNIADKTVQRHIYAK